ncbi:hypothetical protein [Virgibacillus necropolis]|uniref:Group-specific protein n=1 Tax=Virgibacillus necropolis TaxID=163877 RepID=A0A221MDT8_9BACI|nr:hypothetical protein [Virgibacillus necropolis]ASN05801.1 hypothetical protein CFK40_12665 [Virgibacillus necropolis]
MGNSLLMKTDKSSALNFLIYIQNIFLNQNPNEDELRFPYFSKRIAFKKDFELKYEELWNEVSQKVFDDNVNDVRIFYEEKDLFYQSLFEIDACSFKEFSEIHKTFQVWWNSFAGSFSLERSVDEVGQKLYVDLTNSLSQRKIEPCSELHISLLYDECLLANPEVTSNFAILPVKEFFIKYKDLVRKLQNKLEH